MKNLPSETVNKTIPILTSYLVLLIGVTEKEFSCVKVIKVVKVTRVAIEPGGEWNTL